MCGHHTSLDPSGPLGVRRLYIVESGKYDVTVRRRGTEVLKTYVTGDYFGELALLYNCPRAATVTCSTPGRLWVLERAVFDAVTKETKEGTAQVSTLDSFLMSIDVLSILTSDERHHLGEMLHSATYADGEYLWHAGDVADSLVMISAGEVELEEDSSADDTRRLRKGSRLKPGNFFGVSALATDQAAPRRAVSAIARNRRWTPT